MVKVNRSDEALAAYFEEFDFDSAVSEGHDPVLAEYWAKQFREYKDQEQRSTS